MGDLFLSGYKIIGKVVCSQGGHKLTNELLREVFNSNENFSIFELKEKSYLTILLTKKLEIYSLNNLSFVIYLLKINKCKII